MRSARERVQVERRRGSVRSGVWGDEEDPAKVIRRSGQRRGKRARGVQGPESQLRKLFQELFQLTMSNATKKSSKIKTKN